MDPGLLAAIRRYPALRLAIQELALQSESFRAMCSDLVEAESALRRWESVALPEQGERCREYAALVDALQAEIHTAIEKFNERNGSPRKGAIS